MAGLKRYFEKARSKPEFARGYLAYLSELMAQVDVGVIEQIIDAFVEAGDRGNAIYFIGNGGSATTASHFTNDIGIGTRASGIKPLKTFSLVDNLAVITALANDEGYAHVFVRQLEEVLQPGDVLVALSVSGNSANIIEAVRYTKEIGVLTIGCTGFDGGELRRIVDISFHIPAHQGEYGPVEDLFMILDHLIYSYLRLARRGHL